MVGTWLQMTAQSWVVWELSRSATALGVAAMLGSLPILLLGPWAGVEEAARWVLDQAGGRPGHVFNLGHGVLPDTDPDALRRLLDLVHEAGRAG